MLSKISEVIFPGTNYNTNMALMPDYLCNILLKGSDDLSLEDNKKFMDKSGCFNHNAACNVPK